MPGHHEELGRTLGLRPLIPPPFNEIFAAVEAERIQQNPICWIMRFLRIDIHQTCSDDRRYHRALYRWYKVWKACQRRRYLSEFRRRLDLADWVRENL